MYVEPTKGLEPNHAINSKVMPTSCTIPDVAETNGLPGFPILWDADQSKHNRVWNKKNTTDAKKFSINSYAASGLKKQTEL